MVTSPLAQGRESRSWCTKGGSKRNSNLSICLVRKREGNNMMRKGHSLLALWRERSMWCQSTQWNIYLITDLEYNIMGVNNK